MKKMKIDCGPENRKKKKVLKGGTEHVLGMCLLHTLISRSRARHVHP